MTLFCQCEMCKELAKKNKYTLCKYCKEHHDTRLICPAMNKLFESKNTKEHCEYCGEKHDNRLHCLESVKFKMTEAVAKGTPIVTATQKSSYVDDHDEMTFKKKSKINPKDCVYYIELENGKYTVYIGKGSNDFKALRYGEPWRDCCGDNLIYFLMVNLIEAEKKLQNIKFMTQQNEYLNGIVSVNAINDILKKNKE